jgi:hypothetical protein
VLSIMFVLICIPIKVYKGSCFATSSPEFVVIFALKYGHFNWGEMKSKCLHLFYSQGS